MDRGVESDLLRYVPTVSAKLKRFKNIKQYLESNSFLEVKPVE